MAKVRILAPGDEALLARAVAMIGEAELTPERAGQTRLGFLAGQISVPDDFDTMGSAAMLRDFGES
ncbi:MAG TPA: hypothetical protein VLI41_04100 [Phenylobacterium sp.]|uniref:hypothetical protein n=1 Tax=Phenylobacterium sp. TaxID=1871053 RepID=UPI002CF44DB1|nr:hypothetical protein [Phenylobacterium sp.]HSV02365.1 hypothetical protein [Phenylobacterium sp.]